MKQAEPEEKKGKFTAGAFDRLFHPRSIAVLGVSDDPASPGYQFFLQPIREFGFKGNLYPVNPKVREVAGLKAYPNLRDIPGPVDYAISCVPAGAALQLVEDCLAKGVGAICFYTAGFSESGQDEGKALQGELVRKARQGGLMVIGPNCFGVYCPACHITYSPGLPADSGDLAFMSQSGGYGFHFVKLGASRGLRFSKAISYGNAAVISEADLLEYFAQDGSTRLIAAYIEGVREGRRFFEVLRRVAREKPTIILKGGFTGAGARAAASHTASLAGDRKIWDGLMRQSGAISVDSIEEGVDVALAFRHMARPRGRNVAIIGMGGANSVRASDACEREGLRVAPFSQDTEDRLRRVLPFAGTSFKNPLDANALARKPDLFSESIEIISSADEIEVLIVQIGFNDFPTNFFLERTLQPMMNAILRSAKKARKTVAVVLHVLVTPRHWQLAQEHLEQCRIEGVPAFTSLDNAARAIGRFTDYHLGAEASLPGTMK